MDVKKSQAVRCLFGTDGVRDVANRGMMTPEMALRLGRAFILFLAERGIPRPRILLGRDTRRSGPMLEAALTSGMVSAGAQVRTLGIIPTPGVSYLLQEGEADGGAVISASHNPAEYNGIKFFDGAGFKLRDEDEAAIEDYLGDPLLDDWRPTGASIGETEPLLGGMDRYVLWLRECDPVGLRDGWTGVFDCAHGAACVPAKALVAGSPSSLRWIGDAPNGLNINEGVGVMHLSALSEEVLRARVPFGVAFDGDADRTLLCDSRGRVLDGDVILWVLARWLHGQGILGSGLVATVMSNLALEEKLQREGIRVFRCPVGDRYVLETMHREGSLLGGEQSGHVILRDWVRTGDGLCTALLFLRACRELEEDVDTLWDRFARYPQKLCNVKVRDRKAVMESPLLRETLGDAEAELKDRGRLLLRPSGTEPLIRVLVEARDVDLMGRVTDRIVQVLKSIKG